MMTEFQFLVSISILNHLFKARTTRMHNKERNEEATQLYIKLTITLFST